MSRSSAAICWLTADCVYPSRTAARPNVPSVATASSAAEVAQFEVAQVLHDHQCS